MEMATIKNLEKLDPHQKYLIEYYLTLGNKLIIGDLSPEDFAAQQTQLHLELEKNIDYDGLLHTFFNNNGFTKALEFQLENSRQGTAYLGTLLALDIDHLKKFNDIMGHLAGDKLIKTYAAVIEKQTRAADLKGRLGGDEFAIFMAGVDVEIAKIIADRIRTSIIEEVKKVFANISWDQTISIGIAQLRENDHVESLRLRADLALYKAKKQKNTVVIHTSCQSSQNPPSKLRKFLKLF